LIKVACMGIDTGIAGIGVWHVHYILALAHNMDMMLIETISPQHTRRYCVFIHCIFRLFLLVETRVRQVIVLTVIVLVLT
jgi:hypothetical protein